MYEISRRQSFEYAHRLSTHPGACQNVHGHRGEATVVLQAPQLNKDGMVVDFAELKKVMSSWLDEWDHAMLLCIHDTYNTDLLEVLDMMKMKTFTFAEQPTAEIMAKALFDHLNRYFPDMVVSVTISETEKNTATYRK